LGLNYFDIIDFNRSGVCGFGLIGGGSGFNKVSSNNNGLVIVSSSGTIAWYANVKVLLIKSSQMFNKLSTFPPISCREGRGSRGFSWFVEMSSLSLNFKYSEKGKK